MTKEPGQESFEAYNAAGDNPGKTYDGKPVPAWPDLSDDVRAKWSAAERAAGRARLDAFGNDPGAMALHGALDRAHARYDRECTAHSAGLSIRVLLECLEDELRKFQA